MSAPQTKTGWVVSVLALVLIAAAGVMAQTKTNLAPDQKTVKRGSTSEIKPIASSSIENLFRLSPRFLSGGEPVGRAGLLELQRLGIKTIISVDGAQPDSAAAKALGMRYVHLPIGYDGIPREQAVKIVKAATLFPGPVYIHCHHGKHRGPAAAALCLQAIEGWSHAESIDWMKQAGTSPNYHKLFSSVEGFQIPSAAESDRAGNTFPERARPRPLVGSMVAIDLGLDRLKEVKKAGFVAPKKTPDLDPAHEALQLAEHFKELVRTEQVKAKGSAFIHQMGTSAQLASELETALRDAKNQMTAAKLKQLDLKLTALSNACTNCHAQYRDQ